MVRPVATEPEGTPRFEFFLYLRVLVSLSEEALEERELEELVEVEWE